MTNLNINYIENITSCAVKKITYLVQ